MRRCTHLFLLLVLLPLSSHGETLQQVVQHTLETSPEVRTTVHERRAVDQELHQAKAGYWPSIELNAAYGRDTTENAVTRSLYSEGEISLTRREASITLSQMLFDGFNTPNQVERQSHRVDASAYQVGNSSEIMAIKAIEVYLEILLRQELLELAKSNLVIHQKTFEQIQTLAKSGAGRKADAQQSDSRLALASSNLVRAQGSLFDAQVNYQRVVGEAPTNLVRPEEPWIKGLPLPDKLEIALSKALQQHPSILSTKADLQAASAQYEQTRSPFMPRVDLELSKSDNDNTNGMKGKAEELSAMLRMRYNLYRGGADIAKRQEIAERLSAAKEAVRRVERVVQEDVSLSWNALATIRQRLKYLEKYAKSSKEVVGSYKEQFKLSQRNLLDVLDSENESYNAQSSLASAQYAELLGVFRVLSSIGILLDTLGIRKPDEAKPRS